MIHRPKPYFLRKMRKEEPEENLIPNLIKKYKKGGLPKFEPEVAVQMGDVPLDQIYYTDPITKEVLIWKYVGNYWWCRKRKGNKYEFARLMAISNKNSSTVEIVGLWDVRKHDTKQESVVIKHKISGQRGCIVAWNEYEVLIEWIDNVTEVRALARPCRDFDLLEFKYIEDHNKFKTIFDMVTKNNKRS
jgi:hypothetical protein